MGLFLSAAGKRRPASHFLIASVGCGLKTMPDFVFYHGGPATNLTGIFFIFVTASAAGEPEWVGGFHVWPYVGIGIAGIGTGISVDHNAQ